jgi:hypothetical protein
MPGPETTACNLRDIRAIPARAPMAGPAFTLAAAVVLALAALIWGGIEMHRPGAEPAWLHLTNEPAKRLGAQRQAQPASFVLTPGMTRDVAAPRKRLLPPRGRCDCRLTG